MLNRIMVIAPHPDDETLGCGGTLLKLLADGHETFWLVVTNIAPGGVWSETTYLKRQQEISAVSKMYGFSDTFKLDLPTTALDAVPFNQLVSRMSDIIKKVQPSVIFLPNRSDVHTDHQIAFKAAISCCKSFRAPYIKRILMYETLSETEFSLAAQEQFVPNVFVDISAVMQRKLEIMSVYSSEMMDGYLPRSRVSIETLAAYRGIRISARYAEAFMLLFERC